MGEIADSLIDGEFDYVTGEYLGGETGYPRTNYRQSQIPKHSMEKEPTSKAGVCITNMCKDRGFSNSEKIKLVAKFLYGRGYKQLPKLSDQYKIIHSHLKNDFRKFLIENKNNSQSKKRNFGQEG